MTFFIIVVEGEGWPSEIETRPGTLMLYMLNKINVIRANECVNVLAQVQFNETK